MANKLKWHKIKDEIYHNVLWFVYSRKYEEVQKYFKRKGISLGEVTSNGCWFHLEKKGKIQHIIWMDSKDPGLMGHEVFHFVQYALDDVGMNLTKDTAEAYAYYFQYIFDQIIKIKVR